MENENSTSPSNTFFQVFHLIMSTLTAMVGYHIHSSIFWSIVDFIFYPVALIKWLICHEITLNIIKETFTWFFQ